MRYPLLWVDQRDPGHSFPEEELQSREVALMTHVVPTAILSCPSFKDPKGPIPPQVSMYAVRAPPSLNSIV